MSHHAAGSDSLPQDQNWTSCVTLSDLRCNARAQIRSPERAPGDIQTQQDGFAGRGTCANDRVACSMAKTEHAPTKRITDSLVKAIEFATRRWEKANAASPDHPYLKHKRINAAFIRMGTNDRLYVPVYRAGSGELISLQLIDCDGKKRFLRRTDVRGGCFVVPGTLPRVFCQSYASGITVNSATGREVVICFNAENLIPVTAAIARAGDVVAADNDNAPKRAERFGTKVQTYGASHRAAIKTGLPFFMPRKPGHDWNAEGIESTRNAFAGAPTSATPDLSQQRFQRQDLAGFTTERLAAELRTVETSQDAANVAFSVAARMFMNAPAHISLAGIRAFIEITLPAGLVHPSTLDSIIERLDKAMNQRRADALAPVTIPPHLLSRHQHERYDELPTLSAADYHSVIMLWAPMASGKTSRTGRMFVQWVRENTGTRPLAICHRVSLVHDMAKALKIQHYGQVDDRRADDPAVAGLATCLPSITTMAHQKLINQAQYLFIDEISQALRFLAAADHCRTKEADSEGVYDRLRYLVSNAKCLIVADAGCDARTLHFLESCRPKEKFRIIEVHPRNEDIRADYYVGGHAAGAVVGECLAELEGGGHVWIATESARRADSLGVFFESRGFRVMSISAGNKTGKKQKKFLENPEEISLEYDVVIASPVIGSGLSIEHKSNGKWFTLGAFIGGGHEITPADAAQALRRVRYLRRFSLGLLSNSETGKQSSKSIKAAWIEAAELEGARTLPNAFSDLVAEIMATDYNSRADFAAGLLWQLNRAHWKLYPCMAGSAAMTKTLAAVGSEQDKLHRDALLAASVISDAEARRLKGAADRTELENIKMEAHQIRRELNVDRLDHGVLDFWDNGASIRRLDRFSASQGIVSSYDDTGANLALRAYARATAKAYKELFLGFDLDKTQITKAVAATILDRILERRHLLAHLGIVPKSYGQWKEDKYGNLLDFLRPKNARQELQKVLERMGLSWTSHRTRVSIPALITLENKAEGGYKTGMGRYYVVTRDSLATMRMWSERRNAGRSSTKVEAVAESANKTAAYLHHATVITGNDSIDIGQAISESDKEEAV